MSQYASRSPSSSLGEFLAAGVVAEDVPSLFPLLSARPLLAAFVALFRGGDEEVLIRLAVLKGIGTRAESPFWSPHELEEQFVWLDAVKLDTVLKRLREHELLVWDGEQRLYHLAPTGRMALAAIDLMLQFAAEEDAELGFLASQVAAGGAVGRLSADTLRHLLARLAELEAQFAAAVASGSEFRLIAAQTRLQSVWQWMEKGTAILAGLSEEGFDDATWRLAQEIGARQSRIMRMTSVFQRELAAIARQRVHLSQGGLSSSEVAAWLKGLDVDRLAALAEGALNVVPEPVFVLQDVLLDIAEAELIDRQHPDRRRSSLPPPAAVVTTHELPLEPPPEVAELLQVLQHLDGPLPIADVVVGGNFRAASYRFSLLPLLGEDKAPSELAPLAALPVQLLWSADAAAGELAAVNRAEVAAITPGVIAPLPARP
ncbi:MAG: hypothetical protein V5B60_21025 [Accumulibacter sp.]|jgi:hypothetical protein|uniref:hypothetical protein n=1 Tax=Accumulibacter sp. TaxID=2053492 RepID=UPI002FC30A2E